MPIAGRPLLLFMIERARRANAISEIVVATSEEASDDPLAELLRQQRIACYRGNLLDVLDRFTRAARWKGAERVVRLTGDCPLIDPAVIDAVVGCLDEDRVDYTSNVAPPTYPDGLDVEAFTMDALERAWIEASEQSDREHVTPYLRRGRFTSRNVQSVIDCSSLRWTVDHADDLEIVRELTRSVSDAIAADLFDFLRVMEHRGEALRSNVHMRNEALSGSRPAQPVAS
jgi:spore coat polysaccharide biosynthesis protein SpsF (cytidylyltransferase family)